MIERASKVISSRIALHLKILNFKAQKLSTVILISNDALIKKNIYLTSL